MPEPPRAPTVDLDGKPVAAQLGATLFNTLVNAGYLVANACGGQGACRLCGVTLDPTQEAWPPPTAIERAALGSARLAAGERLSCQITITAPLRVSLGAAASRPRGGRP